MSQQSMSESDKTRVLVFLIWTLRNPLRIKILEYLQLKSADRTKLGATFNQDLDNISQHLMVLSRAKLVTRRKEGRFNIYTTTKIGDEVLDVIETCTYIVRDSKAYDDLKSIVIKN